jgi:mono/diheme cytochrome c family protein
MAMIRQAMIRRARWLASVVLVVGVGVVAGPAAHAAEAPAPPVRFDRDILPILADTCFACHGPDAANRQADLRLDTLEGATAPRDGSPAIVPGNPQASVLLERLRSTDPDVVMPPPGTNKVVTPEQREKIEAWIAAGAPYEGHWAYRPLVRPVPPGAGSAIDAFVEKELSRAGLEATGEADRATLARRVSLDLTGLPPEPAEIDAFLADPSQEAFERYVDRLLASPAHAERMAAWWLDLVRYADSVGYHGDQEVTVWPYRDWVIRAFAENMPFDRFTREQLAGDLLPGNTLDQRVAAAYNRLGMMSAEGGAQAEEYLLKYAADRVRDVSGAWLGSTLGCAECHDHKYDPFTMRDFYSMAAYFADIEERGVYDIGQGRDKAWGRMELFTTPEQGVELAALDARVAAAKHDLETDSPALAAAREEWIDRVKRDPWKTLAPVTSAASGGATLALQEDRSLLASGPRPDVGDTTLVFEVPPGPLAGLRLEALTHDSLPQKGPGRADNGNLVVSELKLALRATAAGKDAAGHADDRPVPLARAVASFEQSVAGDLTPSGKWLAAYSVDGQQSGDNVGWAIHEQVGRDQWLIVRPDAPVEIPADTLLVVTIEQHHPVGYQVGRFRLAVAAEATDDPGPGLLPEPVRIASGKPAAERTAEETTLLVERFRSSAPELAGQREALAAAQRARKDFVDRLPYIPVTVAIEPRPVRILPRGNWMDRSGEVVTPAAPAFLSAAAATSDPAAPAPRRTRLDLAAWMTAPSNPIVPRVLANRLWALCFGQGLSRRLDDHGAQGEPPSHPELLDWLASDLRDGTLEASATPWNLRAVLREIVTSRAYRRSSTAPRATVERDPENRLLARQNRLRVEAEMVRDTALSAAGLLVRKVGGPSVKPYQPEGYWDYLNFPQRTWQADKGESLYRRGLYTHWQRQYLHPAMMVFDAPSREECTARRPRSNTPLQALVLLNDPEYVEAARALAAKSMAEAGPEPLARARFLLRRAVGRVPSDEEVAVVVELASAERVRFAADPGAADKLLSIGELPTPPGIDRIDLAAWTTAARAVLNMQETFTRN